MGLLVLGLDTVMHVTYRHTTKQCSRKKYMQVQTFRCFVKQRSSRLVLITAQETVST